MTDLLEELEVICDPFREVRELTRPDQPWRERSCVACGAPLLGWFDVTANHVVWAPVEADPFPVCTSMRLSRSHCAHELRCIADPEYGLPYCHCGGRKQHAAHPAERLRDYYLPRAKEAWGRRADWLLAGLNAIADDLGIDFAAITGEAA